MILFIKTINDVEINNTASDNFLQEEPYTLSYVN